MEAKGFDKVRESVPYMEADAAAVLKEIGQQAPALELGARKGEPTTVFWVMSKTVLFYIIRR